MQTKRTESGTIPNSILISCVIKLSNIWGSVQDALAFYYLLGQGPIFQSLSFYILDKIDTLKNE